MKKITLPHNKAGILSKMIQDYLRTAPCLDGFYKYPFDAAAFEQVIKDKQQDNTNRPALADYLEQQYRPFPVTDATLKNIQLLREEGTFTITTAHQPNIFTGFLFFIYKILGAINTTEMLKQQFPQYNFVPVYWMGSEDHDFEEISHIYLYGEKLQWEHTSGGPVGRLDTAGLDVLLDRIEEKLGALPHAKEVMRLLNNAYREGYNLAGATLFMANELFGKYGLVIIDQDHKDLKELFSPVLKDEVLNGRVSGMVQETIDQINQCNYKIQASPREINCFYLGEGRRDRIVYSEEHKRYEILNSHKTFTADEIAADIDANPQDYSPNVFLRPLYQETVLPNLAYIGGGGELAYWLELKAIFEHYKVNYPMLVLRNSVLILDRNNRRKLEKLELEVADLFMPEEDLVKEYVRRNTTQQLDLQQEKAELEAMYERIMQKAKLVDPTLEKAVDGQKQTQLNNLEAMESKILRAEKRNFETAINQLKGIRAKLLPNNAPAERQENFIPYYAAMGPEFIEIVKAHCNPFEKDLVILAEED